MEISTFAEVALQQQRLVTDTASPAQAAQGQEGTPASAQGRQLHRRQRSACASGLSCVELTCPDPSGAASRGPPTPTASTPPTTAGSAARSLVQDPRATPAYASNVAPFTGSGVEAAVKLDAVYAVHGPRWWRRAPPPGWANMKVSCMAPLSPDRSPGRAGTSSPAATAPSHTQSGPARSCTPRRAEPLPAGGRRLVDRGRGASPSSMEKGQ
jgi:hypothetical protein